MSLILDGTTGVTVEAGTAALPAIVSTTGTPTLDCGSQLRIR